MNILVIGSGGREHALVWKILQSPLVEKVYVAPGNAGTAQVAHNLPLTQKTEIVAWVHDNPIDLVVVGPDNYLAEGLVDELHMHGILTFGPTQAAAEIEWSKSYAKDVMREEGIPTAAFSVFSGFADACAFALNASYPLVIKADGLALGKGVVIAQSYDEAEHALTEMMERHAFGDAGSEVVIEEYLQGMEISVHVFCDGTHAVMFPPSQDHKRIFDGDVGPNTGGMGTIAPVPGVTPEQMDDIQRTIVLPLLAALRKRGRPFSGLLYPGIMLTPEGPKVIEFNARFGDPETESYMRLLKSDIVPIMRACAGGTLADMTVEWNSGAACCVMCASAGYPGTYEKGKVITGLEAIADPEVVIFHAGTRQSDTDAATIVTNGGRVLGITARGDDVRHALSRAYAAVETVSFEGMQYRRDIGQKAL